MLVALVNLTSKYRAQITDEAVALIARACAYQLRYHVAPAWDVAAGSVVFYASESQVPTGSHIIAVMDDSDQQGVLGWHTEDASGVYGRVFAGPSIDNNGGVLQGDWSVAVTTSHEVCEMRLDPACNLFASDGNGKLYSSELCDPVEGQSYQASSRLPVSVSNFILPGWLDPQSQGPYDHLGLLSAPFTLTKSGYVVFETGGQEQQVFGDEYPEWRKPSSASDPLSRRVRKINQLAALS